MQVLGEALEINHWGRLSLSRSSGHRGILLALDCGRRRFVYVADRIKRNLSSKVDGTPHAARASCRRHPPAAGVPGTPEADVPHNSQIEMRIVRKATS